jgi:5'(3')-deoxyribonucleotidase
MTTLEKQEITIRTFWDQDGVFADFLQGLKNIGSSEDDTDKMWIAISKHPNFFYDLPKMKYADEVFKLMNAYNGIVLTGIICGDLENSLIQKKNWFLKHYNMNRVIVTERLRKTDFMQPGDFLIDDNQDNIDRWNEKGGIGIYYDGHNINKLKEDLKNNGLINGSYSNELIERVKTLRSDKKYTRNGYTCFLLDDYTKRQIQDYAKKIFPYFSEDGTNYNLVCDHITRSFPALDDITYDTYPEISIVGHIFDDEKGVQVFVCTVDNELQTPTGSYYHLTYALDNSETAIKNRGFKPKASDSKEVITNKINKYGINSLFNIAITERFNFHAEFKLMPIILQEKKIKPEIVRDISRKKHVFSDGISGFIETQIKGNKKNIKYYYEEDGNRIIHNPDGPAIISLDVDTIIMSRFMVHNKNYRSLDDVETQQFRF